MTQDLISRVASLPGPAPFHRPAVRHRGDAQSVTLDQLAPGDVAPLRALYGFLVALHDDLDAALKVQAGDAVVRRLAAVARSDAYRSVLDAFGRLATSLDQHTLPVRVRCAYHDLRGGSLSAILMLLDLIADGVGRPEDAERLFLLARDHLKMMRNAVRDLDVGRYAADLQLRRHGVALLLEKWG